MRTAIVLFNLGGPDKPEAVRPFLFNLFNDPAIIGAPTLIRWLIATLISRRRAPVAREIYAKIGGASPLRENTEAQAQALETALAGGALGEVRCFMAMRYWHPFSRAAVAAVQAFAPTRIILLPLYPQFSTTTTGSSLTAWHRAARTAGLTAPVSAVCCYPTDPGFVAAVADAVRAVITATEPSIRTRILFSAHGLPKKIVDKGDPYQWQIKQTAAAVVQALAIADLDWVVCYQSRVGPLEWIGPSTDVEIERAGRDGVAVVVAPIAFVSEHSETLVELDIEYRDLAARHGVPAYDRAATVGTAPQFIAGLAAIARDAVSTAAPGPCSTGGRRICPPTLSGCVCRAQATASATAASATATPATVA